MKAIKQIGIKNTLRFIVYAFLGAIYDIIILHLLFLPPFRKIFLQILGAKIGKDTILMGVKFFDWHHIGPKGLQIGKECFIGDETLFDLYDKIVMEDQVTLAQHVTVLTHRNVGYKNHPLQKAFPKIAKPVIFKTGCVIGAAVTILPGVTIGKRAFVATGSVVTKDVPADTLVGGVPAKKIRKI